MLSEEGEGGEAVALLRPIEEMGGGKGFGHRAAQKFLEVRPARVGFF